MGSHHADPGVLRLLDLADRSIRCFFGVHVTAGDHGNHRFYGEGQASES